MAKKAGLKYFNRAVLIAITLWTAIVAVSFLGNYHHEEEGAIDLALTQARTWVEKDVILRHWVANQGGVYIPVSSTVEPNPDLANIKRRDILFDGKRLTLVNPAYFLRLLYEFGYEEYGVVAHLTSLKTIRAENAPEDWEREALITFEQGVPESYFIETIGQARVLRYIKSLAVEESCLAACRT